MPDVFTPELLARHAATIQPQREETAPAQEKPDHGLVRSVGLPVYVGGQAADLVSTLQALNRGAKEVNPVLGSNPAKNAAIKAGITAATAYGLDKLSHRHKALALVLSLIGGGVGTAAAIHNSKVMKK